MPRQLTARSEWQSWREIPATPDYRVARGRWRATDARCERVIGERSPIAAAFAGQSRNYEQTRKISWPAQSRYRAGKACPAGAVVVGDGRVIAEGCNQVTSEIDPTAHAEIVAIRAACQELGRFDLSGSEIYSSCEPCPMCLAAIYWARLDRGFYANDRDDAARSASMTPNSTVRSPCRPNAGRSPWSTCPAARRSRHSATGRSHPTRFRTDPIRVHPGNDRSHRMLPRKGPHRPGDLRCRRTEPQVSL